MQRTGSKEAQRIAKLLARAGVASRREVERMIAEGRVAVNGVAIDTPATLLPSLHGVTVDGVAVKAAAPARLFVFHKPAGVLTTAFDPKGRATIYDRLPRDLPRVIPVGRLDLNTEGLLLLTTDGEFKRQLELPATGVERSYRARAYGEVTQARLEELIEGVEIDGMRYGAIDANLERRTGANAWIELTLTEGKNREVRRVLEYLGLEVSRLIRTRYGPFVLGDMPPGAVGEIRQADLIAFRQALARGRKIDPIPAVPVAAPRALAREVADARPPRADALAPTPAKRRRALPSKPSASAEPRPHRGDKPARPPRQKLSPREAETADEAPARRPAKPPARKAGWARPKPKPRPGGGKRPPR